MGGHYTAVDRVVVKVPRPALRRTVYSTNVMRSKFCYELDKTASEIYEISKRIHRNICHRTMVYFRVTQVFPEESFLLLHKEFIPTSLLDCDCCSLCDNVLFYLLFSRLKIVLKGRHYNLFQAIEETL